MLNLVTTLGITFVLFILALSLLGVSWLFTGKSRLRIGMCGRVPTQIRNKDKGCGTQHTCGICGNSEKSEQEKEDT